MDMLSLFAGIAVGIIIGTVASFLLLKGHIGDISDRYQKIIDEKVTIAAAGALRDNNEQFLTLAEQKMGAVMAKAQGSLESTRLQTENVVNPLREQLAKYENLMRDIETKRGTAYGSLENRVLTSARKFFNLGMELTEGKAGLRYKGQ